MTNDTPGNEIAQTTKADRLKIVLAADTVQQQFKNALGDGNTGAFTASLIDLFVGDQYLQKCDPAQIVMQALKGAILNLPLVKALGYSFLVPYQSKGVWIPQFQLGWKGYVQLAIRTNQYEIINAEEVYEGEYVLKNKLTGEFDLNGKKTSETIIGWFAHFRLKNGFSKTLYMTQAQMVDHAKKYSKSYAQEFSPWKTEFAAMAKKTMLRLLLGKFGYLTIQMSAAFSDDDAADSASEEIKANANMSNFVEADVIPPGTAGSAQPGAGGGQQQAGSQQFNQESGINGGGDQQPGSTKPPF